MKKEKTKSKPKHRLSNLATIFIVFFCTIIILACLFAYEFLKSNELYQIYNNDYYGLMKNNFEEISRRYSIYAMDDYLQDFNMYQLNNTNFKYGVIHSDNFKELDLADLSNYEIQNFDEEFDPDNVYIYSCYRDANTIISYDMSLFGNASLLNYNNLYEDQTVPVTQFVYNYTNNQLYAVGDHYLFPLNHSNNTIIKPSANLEITPEETTAEYLPQEKTPVYTAEETLEEGIFEEEIIEAELSEEAFEEDIVEDDSFEEDALQSALSAEDNSAQKSPNEQSSDKDILHESAFTYMDNGDIVLQTGDYTYTINSTEDGYSLETNGETEEIASSNFQEEVLVLSDGTYDWKEPNSFLYLPQLGWQQGSTIPLCNVSIADYHTISEYGTMLSSDSSFGYSFGKTNTTITYEKPVDRVGVSYYVVSYVPENLDFSKDDLYTQTYHILNTAYRFRYLPALLLVICGIFEVIFLLLLMTRFFRFITRFYRENMPLVLKAILICAGVTFAELLVLAFGNYGAFYHVNRNLLILFFLEKAIIFLFILHYVLQIRKLQKESGYMAAGDYSHSFDTDYMTFDLKKIGSNLNQLQEGMQTAIDERMKSEHFKTELITNVSHDIKTPLTSILSYVDLLKKDSTISSDSAEYLEVLDRQSIKLKKLLEDLIEAAKASTGNLHMELEPCDIAVFVSQISGEYKEKLEEKQIDLQTIISKEPIWIQADTRHLQRVFDNLMINIYKYAMPGTRAYINVQSADSKVSIEIKNISKAPLNISSEALMERFVQGDSSRNTEGHGLGLTIARSLAELMGAGFNLEIDGDLFKVVICWDIVNEPIPEDTADIAEHTSILEGNIRV